MTAGLNMFSLVFRDNPGSFDPSRFLNVESYEHTDDGSGSANSRQNPYSWVPFSGGEDIISKELG